MRIAVTGSKGVVGMAFISNSEPGIEILQLDLPEHDISNFDGLVTATKGCDAILHCAWDTQKDNYRLDSIDPLSNLMTLNVYKAATTNNISKVIMASSNHAHNRDLRDTDGKIRASINPPVPDSPYGAEKVFMEALGRYYAHDHGLQVVCIRIGNINKDDKPHTDDIPSRWMSHRDFAGLVTACLNNDVPDNFQIVYGVSKQATFDWSNPFGFEPKDGKV